MRRSVIFYIITIALFAILMASCYYDSEEALYPSLNSSCDTVNVTYSASIVPTLSSYCTSCHGGSLPSGGISLTTYSGVQTVAASGLLMNAINGTGVSKMPPSGTLPDCRIKQIKIWISNGMLNN
jgi:hypothetical protein